MIERYVIITATEPEPAPSKKQTDPDMVWRRSDDVIECPNCNHIQFDYANESDVSWHGCRKHYKSKCEGCGFMMWVPERREYGISGD